MANKEQLSNAEKLYKKTLDKCQKQYGDDMIGKLKRMRSQNPKEYWKILNQGRSKRQPNISIESLYEYFKDLNSDPSENNEFHFLVCK